MVLRHCAGDAGGQGLGTKPQTLPQVTLAAKG